MIGNIWVLHICPETNGCGEIFPHSFVFPDTLFTFVDEWLQTILFDLIFSIQAQAAFLLPVLPAVHGYPILPYAAPSYPFMVRYLGIISLITRVEHMADMRLAVGCGRAVIERIGLIAHHALSMLFSKMRFSSQNFSVSFSLIYKLRDPVDTFLYIILKPP